MNSARDRPRNYIDSLPTDIQRQIYNMTKIKNIKDLPDNIKKQIVSSVPKNSVEDKKMFEDLMRIDHGSPVAVPDDEWDLALHNPALSNLAVKQIYTREERKEDREVDKYVHELIAMGVTELI